MPVKVNPLYIQVWSSMPVVKIGGCPASRMFHALEEDERTRRLVARKSGR